MGSRKSALGKKEISTQQGPMQETSIICNTSSLGSLRLVVLDPTAYTEDKPTEADDEHQLRSGSYNKSILQRSFASRNLSCTCAAYLERTHNCQGKSGFSDSSYHPFACSTRTSSECSAHFSGILFTTTRCHGLASQMKMLLKCHSVVVLCCVRMYNISYASLPSFYLLGNLISTI